MVIQLLILLMISSGSVLCAAIWNRKYEEILPLTCSGIVMLLFIAGIFGKLGGGVATIAILCVVEYLFATIWSFKKHTIRCTINNILTPASVLFIILFFWLSFLNCDKMADGWDEFTHWADSVKIMTMIDDFVTSPLSHSAFQSYPPAMSLFQYMVQKIALFIKPEILFSEWRLYFAYQIFFLSFLFPFLKDLNIKRPFNVFVSTISVLFMPLIFYSNIYTKIYIDPFLGILSGAGFALILLEKKKDQIYWILLGLICSILVLAKDAGLLFAAFLGVAMIIDCFIQQKELKYRIAVVVWGLVSVGLPKLLWVYNIKQNNARVSFSGKVDLLQLGEVLLGKNETYRITVRDEFFRALLTRGIQLGNSDIVVNYTALAALFVALLSLLHRFYKKHNMEFTNGWNCFFGIVYTQFVVYILGLCVTYMFKFSEYEAVRLASFERYMNIVFLSEWVLIILLCVEALIKFSDGNNMLALVVLCLMLFVMPLGEIYSFTLKESVTASQEKREEYEIFASEVRRYIDEKDRVCIISQEDKGFDCWVLRYSLRPADANTGRWSVGEPFFEGDIWTITITPEEWWKEIEDGYDYVALYHCNDYFLENFSYLFDDENKVGSKTIWKVNAEKDLLEICE